MVVVVRETDEWWRRYGGRKEGRSGVALGFPLLLPLFLSLLLLLLFLLLSVLKRGKGEEDTVGKKKSKQ